MFSGIFASVLGWGAYLDRQVASGLCGWRRLCFLSTPGDCWPSGYVFILPGSYHILTDALYRPLLLPRSAWSLALTVFLSFRELRPVQHYFFASSPYRCCLIYFSADTDANGQCQRAQTCFSILGAVSRLTCLLQWPSFLLVLAKLRASSGTALPLVAPLWALRPWFPDLLQHWLDHTVVIRSRRELLYIPRSRHLSRISVGSGISPSASPAVYQNC